MKIYDKKLAYPYFVWMVLFTVVPLFIVVYYALTDSTGSFTLDNLVTVSGYGSVFARSLLLAIISTVVCLIIAFPVGYFLSRLRVNKQHIMLMLVMLPMWMNFLLRTYAWMGLLSINGPVNAVLGVFGLGPYNMLNTSGAVVLGMVYNFLPFMVFPIYTLLSKMDYRLTEAAADLGCNNWQTLWKVTMPLSIPGIVSGITMVFMPSVTTFFIPRVLGGGNTMMFGDLIEAKFLTEGNWNVGSALSLIMMVLILISLSILRKADPNGEGGGIA